jgi:uncharacterized protein (DUF1330 family)
MSEHEILVGVQVVDDAIYTQYRAAMTPLLEAHGGRFVVDVRVAEVLRSPSGTELNRLFTIRFPSAHEHDAFFANPRYLAIREKLFTPSVSRTVLLGAYDVAPSR